MSTDRPDAPLDVVRTQREHTVSFNERTGKASAPSHVEEPLQSSANRRRADAALTADASSVAAKPRTEETAAGANRVRIAEAEPASPVDLAPPTPAFVPADTVPAFIAAAAAMSDDFISAQALTAAGEALAQVHLHAEAGDAMPPEVHLPSQAGTDGAVPSLTAPAETDTNPQTLPAAPAAVVFPPAGTPAAFLMRNASAPTSTADAHRTPSGNAGFVPVDLAPSPSSALAHADVQPDGTVVARAEVDPTAPVVDSSAEPDPAAGFLKVSLSSAAITRLEGEEARAKALRGQIEDLSARIELRRK